MVKLNGLQKSELTALSRICPHEKIWSGVEPNNCDADLYFYLQKGLVMHLGKGLGYRITDAGRRALAEQEERK